MLCTSADDAATEDTKVSDLTAALKARGFTGTIYPRHTYGYNKYRRVRNGACNVRHPLLIIRPVSTQDVAIGVKVAKEFYMPISVRSGGHSYACMSIKQDSLHFDLRRMNKVELLPPSYNDVSVKKNLGNLKHFSCAWANWCAFCFMVTKIVA